MSRLDVKRTTGQLASPPGCDPRLYTTLPLALLSLSRPVQSFVKSSVLPHVTWNWLSLTLL